jgi:phage terminase large subunit
VDFGVSHPTAMTFIAVDPDGNHYLFDEWEKSDATIREIAKTHEDKTRGKDWEYHIGDSASARERLELKQYGVNLVPANKWEKGENGESNRKAGILLINQMLYDGRFIISDKCKGFIKQMETHFYKDSEKDGQVVKERDDLLDSCRYCCFAIKKDKETGKSKKFKRDWGTSWQTAEKGDNALDFLLPQPY